MRTVFSLLALTTATVFADAAFPITEIPRRVVPEQRCDAHAPSGPLAGRYMCQLGMNREWGEPYPCEIVPPPRRAAYDGYLRFTRFGLPCDLVGTMRGSAKLVFEGSVSCRIEEDAMDVIGREAVFDGSIRSVAGGFRFDGRIDMVTTHAIGRDDAVIRRTRLEHAPTELSFNVCRQPWPAGFESDIDKVERHRPLS